MTDAERLEEILKKARAGGQLLTQEQDALVAEVERLRKAIQTVLDDNETGAGGWGPDVTMAEILRVAIEGES